MKIALDYDLTFTLDPEFWLAFAKIAEQAGHDCRIVTIRDDRYDRTAVMVGLEAKLSVIYTRGVAKRHYLGSDLSDGAFHPDVYIDDRPENILNNSVTNAEGLAAWRVDRNEGPSIPRSCPCGGACQCGG